MYPKQYFLERFRDVDSDELLARYGTGDLTDEAQAAIVEILTSRSSDPGAVAAAIVQARKARFRATKGTDECDYCSNRARFSPVLDGGQRFCSRTCWRNARLMEMAVDIPDAEIAAKARSLRHGACPICHQRTSLVEVRRCHRVWSALFVTQVSERQLVGCRSCGRRANLEAIGVSMLLGWWGLPWGVFITPIQIVANVVAMLRTREDDEPSEALVNMARIALALERHPPTNLSS